MYIIPGQNVYQGEVIGENSREDDMDVNPCKKKHVSNMRASGSDDAIRLIPPVFFSLEQALEHINDDELVEVTPKNIRMRKRVLDRVERGRIRGRAKNAVAEK
jgi:GTP-binding protein